MARIVRTLAVITIAATVAGCWPAPGAGPDRRSQNPYERQISAASASSMTEAWTVQFTDGTDNVPVTDPVVSSVGVHVTAASDDDLGSVYTVDVDGQVLWTRSDFDQWYGDLGRADLLLIGDRLAASWTETSERNYTRWLDVATGNVAALQPGRVEAGRGSQILTYVRQCCTTIDTNAFVISDMFDPTIAVLGEFGAMPSQPLTLGVNRLYHAGPGVSQATPGGFCCSDTAIRGYSTAGPYDVCVENGATNDPTICPEWVTWLDGNAAGPPVLTEDESTVYVGTAAGTMYALDTATGTALWTASVGAPITEAPALVDGSLFVPTGDGDLVVLDATGCGTSTCQALWTAPTGSKITTQPGAARDVVFTGSADGSIHAFATAGCGAPSCDAVWTTQTGSQITGDPAIANGRLYVGTADSRLIAYTPTS